MKKDKTIEEIIRMVVGSYVKQYNDVNGDDLAQEIRLNILHAQGHNFDPTIGDIGPYARVIANRIARSFVKSQRCPVSGKTGKKLSWKYFFPIVDGDVETLNTDSDRHPSRITASNDDTPDSLMETKEIVECIQAIFNQYQNDGKLARGILLENRAAKEVAEEFQVPVWRVYRATHKMRQVIRNSAAARLLWETR